MSLERSRPGASGCLTRVPWRAMTSPGSAGSQTPKTSLPSRGLTGSRRAALKALAHQATQVANRSKTVYTHQAGGLTHRLKYYKYVPMCLQGCEIMIKFRGP
ncbi:hypothetical protein TRIATDRAFT_302297 [Trichoderma atroviride IMI 206040]|uniref:Uncharacterized protein n=1 Tax=Hypocrea atroviridis (strain ATCC 20476 / IMI 206040) TaxID=452589 RepID=G9P4C3_HYPAI|nr:uncharacterized protein TRIATDRAFT_302297 [Trichoderma atroviride IMI 206040]EHK41965.1 hypothetical protein TRIATDRAFT_302297 [Trichoderma atroviride IMI 206040]